MRAKLGMFLLICSMIFCTACNSSDAETASTSSEKKSTTENILSTEVGTTQFSVSETQPDETGIYDMKINDTIDCSWKNKNEIIAYYTTPNNQKVYTVGTIHFAHAWEHNNYPITDIKNCIDNLKPDQVFIESREATYNDYNVVDGPIDMIYAYSYCQDKGIPVSMIDYWNFDNTYASNSTDDARDNHIFSNIQSKLENVDSGKTVLIFYGEAHFFYQQPRMAKAGWTKNEITYGASYFNNKVSDIVYPSSMANVIQDKIDYFQKVVPDIIDKNITNSSVKKDAVDSCSYLIESLTEFKEMVLRNCLYYTLE